MLLRLFICFLLSSVLSAPPVYAGEKRLSPMHIKMGEARAKTGGIRIHKGQMPASHKTINKMIRPAPKGATMNTVIDAKISCAMNRAVPMTETRVQILANALNAYMRDEKRDRHLIDTLKRVSKETGVDFELLVLKAMLESDLGRAMKSPASSARGVFQYIETTWLSLIQKHGAQIGYPHYAQAIVIDPSTGQPSVSKTLDISKFEILDLRFNPYSAATIKALQIKDETATIKALKSQKNLTATDHYIAHMMGMGLAEEFYKLKNENSTKILAQSANPLFREAVALNPYFFYDEKGRALTAPQAYNHFKARIAQAYERLRAIEVKYGKGPAPDDCAKPSEGTPAVEAAYVEKPEMLGAMGLTVAKLDSKI